MRNEDANPSQRRVLISGASGMLGSALLTALIQHGAEVVRLVRRDPESREELRWNPAAPSPFLEPQRMESVDAVIHLSGANLAARRWTPQFLREVTASRVDSTR